MAQFTLYVGYLIKKSAINYSNFSKTQLCYRTQMHWYGHRGGESRIALHRQEDDLLIHQSQSAGSETCSGIWLEQKNLTGISCEYILKYLSRCRVCKKLR